MNIGLGVRPELFEPISEQLPKLDFFEAHSENYFGDSIARSKLLALREDYPISMHGVGLSLGRADDLDASHLKQLKQLVAEVVPLFVSEHLAWSAYAHTHLPDLLPLPLNRQSLDKICEHIEQLQIAVGQQILLENPSNYLLFEQLQIPEPEFLNEVAAKTGCGLLLDVNNVFVSSHNLQRSAEDFIAQLNSSVIKQFHLAGHTPLERNGESVLIDTHNQLIRPEVWQLFEFTLQQHGKRPTLIEWDSNFPKFEVLLEECARAEARLVEAPVSVSSSIESRSNWTLSDNNKLAALQQMFLQDVLHGADVLPSAIPAHQNRLWIYQNNVASAILDYLQEVYPAVKGVVGDDFFRQMVQRFIQQHPPSEGNINVYGGEFKSVINQFEGLQELPYLEDLMDYEWALHQAYFSTTNSLLNPASYSQEELLRLKVSLNPSVSIVASSYPIYEIHRQSLPDFTGEVAIDLTQSADTVLVYKQGQRVASQVLDDAEAGFIQQLASSNNLMQAIEALSGSIEEESLSSAVALVLQLELLQIESTQ